MCLHGLLQGQLHFFFFISAQNEIVETNKVMPVRNELEKELSVCENSIGLLLEESLINVQL
jgi:hypothetical protein